VSTTKYLALLLLLLLAYGETSCRIVQEIQSAISDFETSAVLSRVIRKTWMGSRNARVHNLSSLSLTPLKKQFFPFFFSLSAITDNTLTDNALQFLCD